MAGRLSTGLKQLEGRLVAVRVWGAALPGETDPLFRVRSVRAFGAGLLFRLEPGSGGKGTLLKVAQPASPLQTERGVEIPHAAYVQWAGRRLPHVDGAAALTLSAAE
ncbi:MAG TPA: hypothetical protein VF980_18440 [Thermoanaerobaculia bacterium]